MLTPEKQIAMAEELCQEENTVVILKNIPQQMVPDAYAQDHDDEWVKHRTFDNGSIVTLVTLPF